MSPDEYLDDDEPRLTPRSIFSTGWFRALLVLGVLGVTLVFAVPYVLEWLEPPPPRRQVSRPESTGASRSAPPAVKSAPAPVAPPAPAPTPTVERATAPPSGKAAPTPAPSKLGEASAPKGDVIQPVPPPRSDKPLLGPGPKTAPPATKAPPAEKALPGKAPAVAKAPEATKPPELPAKGERRARVETPLAEKAEPAKPAPPKGEPLRREAAVREPAAKAPPARPARPVPSPGAGDFWVQVGAFQDDKNAERLAVTLREGPLTVEVVRVTRSAGGGEAAAQSQHQVLVSGSNVETVTTALRGTGKSAQAGAGGVVVRPVLSMREAVDLSQKLKADGLTASIRRVGAGSGEAGGTVFHVVRVGGYATRPAAVEAKRALEGRGVPGFVTRGPAK